MRYITVPQDFYKAQKWSTEIKVTAYGAGGSGSTGGAGGCGEIKLIKTMKFKVGDIVRAGDVQGYLGEICDTYCYIWQNIHSGSYGSIHPSTKGYTYSWAVSMSELTLVKSGKSNNMSVLEKFALAFKSEPEKSLRKLGLLNGDDLATQEGMQVYVSYLMKKDKTFQEEVVAPLIAEDRKES